MTEEKFMQIYSMILQQHKIPLVNINTKPGGVVAPKDYVKPDGTLILNISPRSVHNLYIENDTVYCGVSFRGKHVSVSFPLLNVIEFYMDEAS